MKRKQIFIAMFVIFACGVLCGVFSEGVYDYVMGRERVCKRCGFGEFKYVSQEKQVFNEGSGEGECQRPFWIRGVKKREEAEREQHFREKMFNWMLSDRLKLTPEQREKHFQLVLENKRNLSRIMDPIREEVNQEFDRSYKVIQEILTPEQQKEFQKIICEFDPPGFDINKVAPPLDEGSETNSFKKDTPEPVQDKEQ